MFFICHFWWREFWHCAKNYFYPPFIRPLRLQRETVLFQTICTVRYCTSTIPASSANNPFLGPVDALEWWECKSNDIRPSLNERVKRLPWISEIAISLAVLRISPLVLFLSLLTRTSRVAFDLCYQFVVQCSAQSCETAIWCWRMPTAEIPLPST